MSSLLASLFRHAAGSWSRAWWALSRSSCIPAASAACHAALINTDPCDNATLTQPFLPWGDSNSYKLVPGGDFEGSMSGWTLSGGATVGRAVSHSTRPDVGQVLDVSAGRR